MARSIHHIGDAEFRALPKEEKQAMIEREADYVMHACEFINAGLAVRAYGLIYLLPLCHDAYGENI